MKLIKSKAFIIFVLVIILLIFSSCLAEMISPEKNEIKHPSKSFLTYGDSAEMIIELNKINNSVWVHTSYHEENGALKSSNGLLIVNDEGVVLVDTPWSVKQMESLDKLVKESFNADIKIAITTQTGKDRMGGTGYLIEKQVPIASLEIVAKAAREKGFTVPNKVINTETAVFVMDNIELEIYYPGPGPTTDNTVVWIDKYNLLFGGNMVKELGASSLEDSIESDLSSWAKAIEAIKERYKNIEIVVPGHGQWGDSRLLDYTLEMLEEI